MSVCKDCGEDITWATTQNGKSMPLDAEPSPAGEWAFVKGKTWHATDEDRRLHRPLYTAHWAKCPGADRFRRR